MSMTTDDGEIVGDALDRCDIQLFLYSVKLTEHVLSSIVLNETGSLKQNAASSVLGSRNKYSESPLLGKF